MLVILSITMLLNPTMCELRFLIFRNVIMEKLYAGQEDSPIEILGQIPFHVKAESGLFHFFPLHSKHVTTNTKHPKYHQKGLGPEQFEKLLDSLKNLGIIVHEDPTEGSYIKLVATWCSISLEECYIILNEGNRDVIRIKLSNSSDEIPFQYLTNDYAYPSEKDTVEKYINLYRKGALEQKDSILEINEKTVFKPHFETFKRFFVMLKLAILDKKQTIDQVLLEEIEDTFQKNWNQKKTDKVLSAANEFDSETLKNASQNPLLSFVKKMSLDSGKLQNKKEIGKFVSDNWSEYEKILKKEKPYLSNDCYKVLFSIYFSKLFFANDNRVNDLYSFLENPGVTQTWNDAQLGEGKIDENAETLLSNFRIFEVEVVRKSLLEPLRKLATLAEGKRKLRRRH
jgi:hypothetical protein